MLLFLVTFDCFSQVVFSSGKAVEDLQPQFDKIRSCTGRGIAVTGLAQPDSGFDYVYRLFAPKLGVNEVSMFICKQTQIIIVCLINQLPSDVLEGITRFLILVHLLFCL